LETPGIHPPIFTISDERAIRADRRYMASAYSPEEKAVSIPLQESSGRPPGPVPHTRRGRAGGRLVVASAAVLVALTALPVCALVVPHTLSFVIPQALRDLQLGTGQAAGLVRANGLALPALLLAVPGSAVAAWRLSAWPVLLVGLLGVLGGQLAAEVA